MWRLDLGAAPPRPEGLRGSRGLFVNGAEGLGEVVPAERGLVARLGV